MKKSGKEDVRQLILTLAEQEFADKGYAGTRIGSIAKKGNLNTAIIHYYFESKERLYEAVLSVLFQKWENNIRHLTWEGLDPEQIITQYVHMHYKFQYQQPNLFKIAQWEYMEGNDVFAQEVGIWMQDIQDKVRAIQAWKQRAEIRPDIHGKALLLFIWGMMNQFYFRPTKELSELLESPQQDSELLHSFVAEQITKVVLYGIVPREQSKEEEQALAEIAQNQNHYLPTLAILLEDSEPAAQANSEDYERILRTLTDIEHFHTLQLSAADVPPTNTEAFFLIASTEYGEMSPTVAELLMKLRSTPSFAADCAAGVWILGNDPEASSLQKTIEDAFSLAGAFVIPRIAGSSLGMYLNHFQRLAAKLNKTN